MTLDLSEDAMILIEKLCELCDRTPDEVVGDAIALLGWASVEAARGCEIAAVDESQRIYKAAQMDALANARKAKVQ